MSSGWYRAGYRAGYRGIGWVAGYPPAGAGPTPPPGPPLTGLKLWLDAGKDVTVSGSIVSAWGDQSGNGNDATVYAVQPGSYVGPRLDTNVVNGLPGLNSFYATNVAMGAATALLAANSDYHIVTVVRFAPVSAGFNPGGFGIGGGLADIGAGITSVFGDFGGDVFVSGSTNQPNTGLIANNLPYLFELASDGTTQTAAINGTPMTLSSTAPMVCDGSPSWNIFGDYVGGNEDSWSWTCEFLVYDHVLTGADLTALRAYVSTKYGL